MRSITTQHSFWPIKLVRGEQNKEHKCHRKIISSTSNIKSDEENLFWALVLLFQSLLSPFPSHMVPQKKLENHKYSEVKYF